MQSLLTIIATSAIFLLGVTGGGTFSDDATFIAYAQTSLPPPTAVSAIVESDDPDNLALDGAISVTTIDIQGSTYAIVTSTGDGIQIINITDPARPMNVTTIVDGTVDGNGDTYDHLGGAWFVTTTVINDIPYALVASNGDDGFTIINIEDPANPVLASQNNNGNAGFLRLDNPRYISVVDIGRVTYALVAASARTTSGNGLQIVNITDPTDPRTLLDGRGVAHGDGQILLDSPRAISTETIGGTPYAIVASFFSNSLQILDMSSPATPTHVSNIVDNATLTLAGPRSVDTFTIDDSLYAIATSQIDNGIQIINITTPTQHPIIVSNVTDTTELELDQARHVTTVLINENTYALVAGREDDGVQIIDISDPANPDPIYAISDDTDGFTALNGASFIDTTVINGTTYAVVASNQDDGIQIIDLVGAPAATLFTDVSGSTNQRIISFTVSFSEPVMRFDITNDVAVSSGTVQEFRTVDEGIRYAFNVADPDPGLLQVHIRAGAVQDTDNLYNRASNQSSIIIDNQNPTVSSATADTHTTITLQMSEPVTVTSNIEASDFALTNVASTSMIGSVELSPQNNTQIILTLDGSNRIVEDDDPMINYTRTAGFINDTAGNALGNIEDEIRVDTDSLDFVLPTVSSATADTHTTITLHMSEPVTVTPDVVPADFGLGGVDSTSTIGSVELSTRNNTQIILTLDGSNRIVASDTDIMINYTRTAGFINDTAGNTLGNIEDEIRVTANTLDFTPPTATLSLGEGVTDPTSRATIQFVVSFSEPVTELLLANNIIASTGDVQNLKPILLYLDSLGRNVNSPEGVAVNSLGHVYIADTGNNRIQIFDSDGVHLIEFGSMGSATDGRHFNRPTGLFIDSSDRIFIADTGNHRIQVLDDSHTPQIIVGSFGKGNDQFSRPEGIATNSSGHIFVADTFNHRIKVLDSSGRFLEHWGRLNNEGNPVAGANTKQFNSPAGIAVNSRDRVFVADTGNSRIQVFDSNGNAAGSSLSNSLNKPTHIAFDEMDNIYVSNNGVDRITVFDSTNTLQFSFGSTGNNNNQFNSPQGIAFDSINNHLYVADDLNNHVQKFNPSAYSFDAIDSADQQMLNITIRANAVQDNDGLTNTEPNSVFVTIDRTAPVLDSTPELKLNPTGGTLTFDFDDIIDVSEINLDDIRITDSNGGNPTVLTGATISDDDSDIVVITLDSTLRAGIVAARAISDPVLDVSPNTIQNIAGVKFAGLDQATLSLPLALFTSSTPTISDNGASRGMFRLTASSTPAISETRFPFTLPLPIAVSAIDDGDANADQLALERVISVDTIVIDGKTYAIAASTRENGIQIINITDPVHPDPLPPFVDGDDPEIYLANAFSVTATVINDTPYAIVVSSGDGGFNVINITNPTSPVLEFSDRDNSKGGTVFTELAGARSVTTVVINGTTYAVVAANDDDGIQIINMTNPAMPTFASVVEDTEGEDELLLDGPRSVTTVVIDGKVYAVVASFDDNGIQIINMTNPAEPRAISKVPDTGAAPGDGLALGEPRSVTTVVIDGKTYAIATSNSEHGIQIINMTNPAEPEPVSKIVDSDSSNLALERARSVTTVVINGVPYAIVASINDNGIQIIDISDPANPRAKHAVRDGEMEFTELAGASSVTAVVINGITHVVVASINDGGIQIIDLERGPVIDPISVTLSASSTPTISDDAMASGMFRLDASTVPAISDGSTTMFRLDASTSPVISDAVRADTQSSRSASSTPTISDTATPAPFILPPPTAISALTDNATLALHGAVSVDTIDIQGSTYAIATGTRDSGGVQIINITDPARPIHVTTIVDTDSGDYQYLGGAWFVTTTVINDIPYALVAANGDSGFTIIDITNPADPELEYQNFDGGQGFSLLANPSYISVVDINNKPHALVAARGDDNGIQIMDISTPSSPQLTGLGYQGAEHLDEGGNILLDSPRAISTVKIGDYTYAVVASFTSNSLQILNITDPADLTHVSNIVDNSTLTLADPRSVDTFDIDERWYAIATSQIDNGIQIIEITDPATPTVISNVTDTDELELLGARHVTTVDINENTYAIVAGRLDNGVQIIDITDPVNPDPVHAIRDDEDGFTELEAASFIDTTVINGTTYAIIASIDDDGIQIIDLVDAPSATLFTDVSGSTNQRIISFTVSFSEVIPEFELDDIMTSSGTRQDLEMDSESQYTFNVADPDPGPLQVRIPAGVVQDTDELYNRASNQSSIIIDNQNPTVSSATADTHTTIILQMSKPVTVTSNIEASDFALTNVASTSMIGSVELSPQNNTQIILTLDGSNRIVASDTNIMINYTRTAGFINDTAGNALDDIENEIDVTTNTLEFVPPEVSSATADTHTTITLHMSEPVTVTPDVAADDFVLDGVDSTSTIGSVELSTRNNTQVILTLNDNNRIVVGDTNIRLSYTHMVGTIHDTFENILVDFTNEEVTTDTLDFTPPTATLSLGEGVTDPTSRATIQFVVSFSEPVTELLLADDIIASTGDVQNLKPTLLYLDSLGRNVNSPEGVAVNSLGHVYIADTENNRIQIFDSDGQHLIEFGSRGSATNGRQFKQPTGLFIDSSDRIFIADTGNHRIQILDDSHTPQIIVGSFGRGDNQFSRPEGIATNSSGHIFVADTFNHRIKVLDSSGRFLEHWGRLNNEGNPVAGTNTKQFNSPAGIAVNSRDRVFVADMGNSRIQVFDSNGNAAGSSLSNSLNKPTHIAFDEMDNIYVSNNGVDRITVFDNTNTLQFSFGSTGNNNNQFNSPQGIAFDSINNHLYVADDANNHVQKFNPSAYSFDAIDSADQQMLNITIRANAVQDNDGLTNTEPNSVFVTIDRTAPVLDSTPELKLNPTGGTLTLDFDDIIDVSEINLDDIRITDSNGGNPTVLTGATISDDDSDIVVITLDSTLRAGIVAARAISDPVLDVSPNTIQNIAGVKFAGLDQATLSLPLALFTSSTPTISDETAITGMFRLAASTVPAISDGSTTSGMFRLDASTSPVILDAARAETESSRSASSTPTISDDAMASGMFRLDASTVPAISDGSTTSGMFRLDASTVPAISDGSTTSGMFRLDASTSPVISDAARAETESSRSASSTPTISDDATTTGQFTTTASSTPAISDTARAETESSKSASSTPAISDSVITLGQFIRSASSTPAISDTSRTTGMFSLTASSTPTISDDATTTSQFTTTASSTPAISDTARADTESSRSASTNPVISDAVTTVGKFIRSVSTSPAISDSATTTGMFRLAASTVPAISDDIMATGMFRLAASTVPAISDDGTIDNITRLASTTPIISDIGRTPHPIELISARSTSDNSIVLQFNQEVRTDSSSFDDIEIPIGTSQAVTGNILNNVTSNYLSIVTLFLNPGEISTYSGKINVTASLTDIFGNGFNVTGNPHSIVSGLGTSPIPLTPTDNRVVITTEDSTINTITIPRDVSGILDLSVIASTTTLNNTLVTNATTPNTQITIKLAEDTDEEVTVVIQPSTRFTQDPREFSGVINLPAIRDQSDGTCPPTFTVPDDRVASCIVIGLENSELAIDKPVKITFANEAGNIPYFGTEQGELITEIGERCESAEIPNVDGNEIRFDSDDQVCYFEDGDDMIIWTTHFTTFGTISPAPEPSTPSSSSGSPNRGGGGGGSTHRGSQGNIADNPIIYEAKWNVCNDSNDLYVITGPNTATMIVTTTQAQNGLSTASLTDDTSIPGRHVYHTTVGTVDPIVYISAYSISGRSGFVETATLKMDLDSCEGNFVFKDYVEPISSSSNVQPSAITEPTTTTPPESTESKVEPEQPTAESVVEPEQTESELPIAESVVEPEQTESVIEPEQPTAESVVEPEQTEPTDTTTSSPPQESPVDSTTDADTSDSELSFIDRLVTSVNSIIKNIFSIFNPAGTITK